MPVNHESFGIGEWITGETVDGAWVHGRIVDKCFDGVDRVPVLTVHDVDKDREMDIVRFF